ncbi:MAG TPA: MBL fold metallo-hydrolase, partial [Vicinamibacterales bacterium]
MNGTRFRLVVLLTVALAGIAGMATLGVGGLAAQQGQNFENVEIKVLQVRENIHMLVGAGGNITVQTGPDGVLIVDSQFAPLSNKILAAIRRLSNGPIRYLINTHYHADHTGGNENLRKAGST